MLWNHRIGAFVSLGGILRAAAAACQKVNKPPQCITTQNIKYKNSQIQNTEIQTDKSNLQIPNSNRIKNYVPFLEINISYMITKGILFQTKSDFALKSDFCRHGEEATGSNYTIYLEVAETFSNIYDQYYIVLRWKL